MTDDRTRRIIEKIRALRAKTTDAGATEAEAASAADMAQRLMAQYQIDADEIAAAHYDRFLVKMTGVNLRDPSKSHPFTAASDGIEHITGAKLWFAHGGVFVCGDVVSREMAIYLLDMVRNVLDAEWRRESKRRIERLDAFLVKQGGEKSTLAMREEREVRDHLREIGIGTDARTRRSYLLGMASRICKRMLAMSPARSIPPEVALRLMNDKKIKPDRNGPGPKFDAREIALGARAGESVPISMGVGANAAPLMIGRKA